MKSIKRFPYNGREIKVWFDDGDDPGYGLSIEDYGWLPGLYDSEEAATKVGKLWLDGNVQRSQLQELSDRICAVEQNEIMLSDVLSIIRSNAI